MFNEPTRKFHYFLTLRYCLVTLCLLQTVTDKRNTKTVRFIAFAYMFHFWATFKDDDK